MKRISLLPLILFLFSCSGLKQDSVYNKAFSGKTLYSWENFEKNCFHYLKDCDEKSTRELTETYQKLIARPGGTRGQTPPGVYADYGFLLLSQQMAEEGIAMLEREMAAYPESETYIMNLLTKYPL